MATETMRLIRDGGKGVWWWGKREIIYLSLYTCTLSPPE